MKGSTLIAIVIGLTAIFGAFLWEGGDYRTLFMWPAMLIVFGGTLAAGLAGSSMEKMSRIPKLFWISFAPPKYDLNQIINQIVAYSGKSRREGILSLEKELPKVKHPYLKKLLETCIDGADPETLLEIYDSEIEHVSERHEENIGLFLKMGGYSPTMGIIGTVMGLIATLAAAGEDPNVLIHHIASAFIATMWGILMANIVWLPVGDKLRTLHNEELRLMRVIADGVHALQIGETPTVIHTRLVSAFPIEEQNKLLRRTGDIARRNLKIDRKPVVTKKENEEDKPEKEKSEGK